MKNTMKMVKSAELEVYLETVDRAIKLADAASLASWHEMLETMPRNQYGEIVGGCGWSYVFVYGPSRRLINAIKSIERWRGKTGRPAKWIFAGFSDHVSGQSSIPYQKCCEAACSVLVRELQGEGSFFVDSFVD